MATGPRLAGVAGGSRHLVLYFKLLIYIHFLMFFSATLCYPHDHGWLEAVWVVGLVRRGEVRASDLMVHPN